METPAHESYAAAEARSANSGRPSRLTVIGHRGAAGHAPENTVAAFDRGIALGADGVETDVRATRDGVLVLLHDATVDRTTDGSGAVADLTWAEVAALDAGARFAGGQHAFGVQRIPRLDTFLDHYGGRTTFRLEIKARGVEGAAVRMVRARGVMDTAVFTSFQPEAIKAVRLTAPEAQTAYLSGAQQFDDAMIETALAVGANEVAPRAELVEPGMVARAQLAGLRVWAWGVKSQDVLRHAVAGGIGGCTLDYPDWATAPRA
ncbi:MAG: glycerophosphodiester phosphodiesterase [Chloroflexota bacterium]|nr:glycerophosphodiester phosphodiesterase [Chloroflexota bacterium]